MKYEGYRLIVACDGERVRLISRGGYDLASRFPWIVEADEEPAPAIRDRR